jgi:hypothetical protein
MRLALLASGGRFGASGLVGVQLLRQRLCWQSSPAVQQSEMTESCAGSAQKIAASCNEGFIPTYLVLLHNLLQTCVS